VPDALSTAAVLEAGLRIGLPRLSVSAVAEELGVSRAAVHKYVSGRTGLEELVGEHLVATFRLPTDRGQPDVELLLDLARALRAFCLATPGTATYLATRFPRSAASAQIVEDFCAVLVRRGFRPDQALRLESLVANVAIGLVRTETDAMAAMLADPRRHAAYVADIEAVFAGLPVLGEAWTAIRTGSVDDHFEWTMRCVVVGGIAEVTADTDVDPGNSG
jgi:AcrR family transcriptional regulator